MFNNLIYFIVVLLIYSTYRPSGESIVDPAASLVAGLLLLAGYYTLVRFLFTRLKRSAAALPQSGAGAMIYQRLLTRLMILAVALFTIHVYFLNFKEIVLSIPVIGASSTLTDLGGLILFGLYLSLVWSEAFGVYEVISGGPGRSGTTRIGFVLSQLRLNLPIILPWLIISLVMDGTGLLPDGPLKAWLVSETGQVVIYLVFLGGLSLTFPLLIRYLWGLTPLPAGPDRTYLEDFCRRNGFKYSDIMLWPLNEGKALTAGVMGLIERARYILITNSLLEVLDRDEMEAVIAHEQGHIKHRHLQFYIFFFIGYLVLAYFLIDLIFFLLLVNDWTADLLLSDQGRYGTAVSLLYSAPLVVVMVVYFRFVLGAFMRNFERQADLFSLSVTGTIRGLVSSLEKIAYYSGQSRFVPSWHHFSIAQRVDFLKACEQEPARVKAHGRKVRYMIAGYLVVVLAIGLAGYQVRQKGFGQEFNQTLALRALQARIERVPQDARAHRFMGDLYFEKSRLEEATRAYERSLALAPADPVTNNNLAWLLATKENPTAEDKQRALILAGRAASIRPDPFILDTLAEAFYVNGRPDLALQVIDRALSLVKPGDDKKHYLEQRAKFEREMKLNQGGEVQK